MPTYYIRSNNPSRIFALDSTTDISVTMAGKTTDFPIESGVSVSDHYVNQNKVITFKGSISTSKSLSSSGNLSPAEYITELEVLKESKEVFSVHWHPTKLALDNCVFTSLVVTQNQSRGYLSSEVNSASISFTAKQIRFADQATVEVVPANTFVGKVSGEEVGDGNTDDNPIDTPEEGLDAAQTGLWNTFTGLFK